MATENKAVSPEEYFVCICASVCAGTFYGALGGLFLCLSWSSVYFRDA